MRISKRIMWIISKNHREIFFLIFLQSVHQIDMKNVVKCWKDFLPYFTTLETYRAVHVCSCWMPPKGERNYAWRNFIVGGFLTFFKNCFLNGRKIAPLNQLTFEGDSENEEFHCSLLLLHNSDRKSWKQPNIKWRYVAVSIKDSF